MIDRLSGWQSLSVATPGLGPVLEKQQQLYQRICAYELDDPSHDIGFLAHLMRANGWSRLFALRAIEEYRKFVFLALVADHQVTPSDQVDQVWHLHLLFSDAYWNDFCPRVLGRPLHHHPTKGGQAERDRFHELYRATIRSYRQHFGEPPADLWPPVDVRFGRDLQMQRGRIRRPFRPWRGWPAWRRWRWSVPMGGLLIGLGVIGSALAAAAGTITTTIALTGTGIPNNSGATAFDVEDWLWSIFVFIVAVPLISIIGEISEHFLQPRLRQPTTLATIPQLNDMELAYLYAGRTGVLHLTMASLVQKGLLRADYSHCSLAQGAGIKDRLQELEHKMLGVHLQLVRDASTAVPYEQLMSNRAHNDTCSTLLISLQQQELMVKRVPRSIGDWVRYLPYLSIVGTATFLIILPMSNLLPMSLGFLRFHLIAASFLAFCFGLVLRNNRTIWGEHVLGHYKRLSVHDDLMRQIALQGHVAMTGGGLDDLRRLIEKDLQVKAEQELKNSNSGGCAC